MPVQTINISGHLFSVAKKDGNSYILKSVKGDEFQAVKISKHKFWLSMSPNLNCFLSDKDGNLKVCH